jgi:hypothetical protein
MAHGGKGLTVRPMESEQPGAEINDFQWPAITIDHKDFQQCSPSLHLLKEKALAKGYR